MAVFYSSFSRFSKLESKCCLDRSNSLDMKNEDLDSFEYSGMIFSESISYFCFLGTVGAGVFSSFFYSLSFLLTLMSISGLPLTKLGWEKIFLVGSFLDLWKPYIFNWILIKKYLSYEAVNIPVPEVMGQNNRLEEVIVLDDELFAWGEPFNNGVVILVLNKCKRYADNLKAFLNKIGHSGLGVVLDHYSFL